MDAHLQAYREEIWQLIRQSLAGCNSMALIQLLWAARKIARQPGVRVGMDDEALSRKALAYAKPERRGKQRHDGLTITRLEDVTYRLLRERDDSCDAAQRRIGDS